MSPTGLRRGLAHTRALETQPAAGVSFERDRFAERQGLALNRIFDSAVAIAGGVQTYLLRGAIVEEEVVVRLGGGDTIGDCSIAAVAAFDPFGQL